MGEAPQRHRRRRVADGADRLTAELESAPVPATPEPAADHTFAGIPGLEDTSPLAAVLPLDPAQEGGDSPPAPESTDDLDAIMAGTQEAATG